MTYREDGSGGTAHDPSQPDGIRTGRETRVDPGDLDDFARRVRMLAEDWAAQDSAQQKVLRVDNDQWGFPKLGQFEEADTLRQQYQQARQGMAQNFNDLHNLLQGLGDASAKIAEQYRSTEALNQASMAQIDRILGEEMATQPNPGQTRPQGPSQQA